MITANLPRPYGYGRIVRTGGRITKIVEERDASDAQRKITEINSGIYAFALEPLFKALDSLGTANNQGEYYLPDLVAIYRKQRKPSPPTLSRAWTRSAASIVEPNSQRSAPWSASKKTKS